MSFTHFIISSQSSIPVDLMPGSQDPANFVLPQQPLHRCMLPNSYRLSTLQLRTNPFSCRIAGRLIMGTSGQPVKDIMKNCNLEDPLDVLQKTLEWRHVCPTAPDTLGCYPYMGEDPFIFDACPDVYFAGNQESFSDRLWTSMPFRFIGAMQSIFITHLFPIDFSIFTSWITFTIH